tara:strand:- start:32439 stop:32993 length:555 start_codon:yes stop_codon:yes gene_type:complete
MKSIGILLVSFFFSFSHAASLQGVDFPDTAKVGEKQVILNGLGLRLATIFKVKAYVAALYLEKKSNSWHEIQKDPGNKKLILHFLTSLKKEKLKDSLVEAYRKNLSTEDFSKIRPAIAKMNRYIKSMKKGQTIEMHVSGNESKIYVRGKHAVTIEDAFFAKNFLVAYLGENPPNPEIKSGLLGK